MSKTWLAVAAAILAFVALMYFAMKGQTQHSCEVCIEFNGRTQCRSAKGPTTKEATQTAADNACAMLTSGMTEIMSCGRTEPKSVKCQ
jgi:hypothetical protein